MEDPYASFIANCNYSSSQEDLFNHSLHAREDEHLLDPNCPQPNPPPPSTSADVFAGGGIVICSAPETPLSDSVATPSGEDFRTPPEESHRLSSEEPPPPPQNRSSKIAAVLSSGKVRVEKVDRESWVGDKRSSERQESSHSKRIRVFGRLIDTPNLKRREKGSPIQEQFNSKRIGVPGKLINSPSLETREMQSPIQESLVSKRIRASGRLIITPNLGTREKQTPIQESPLSKRIRSSDKLINTPNLKAREEGEGLVKRRIEFQIDMEVNAKMNVETEEVDTVVIDDSDEQSCDDEDVGISNLQQAQEIEEEMEDGNGNMEAEGHTAKDPSRQGRRELPSWARLKEDNRKEDNNHLNTKHTVNDDMKAVLQVLALLAREESPSCGTGDILETIKRRGLTFPAPKCWHGDDEDNDL